MAKINKETVGNILDDVAKTVWSIVQKREEASPKEMQILNLGNEILEVFKEVFRIVAEGGTSKGEAWYVSQRLNGLYEDFKRLKA